MGIAGKVLAAARRHRWISAAILAALACTLIILELGLITQERIVYGPFEAEPGGRIVKIQVGSALPIILRPDINSRPTRSGLRLWVNGVEYRAAHSQHADIRAGAAGAFSHWYRNVLFSLPSGTANGPATQARLVYPLQLGSPWYTLVCLLVLLAAWAAVERPWLSAERVGRILSWPARLTTGAIWLAFALSLSYAAVTLWAWTAGWALPTTAALRVFGRGRQAALAEPDIAIGIFAIVMLGAIAGWLAALFRADQTLILQAEATAARAFTRFGLPIALALALLYVSALWTGVPEKSAVTIIGLVPLSDAGGYYNDANQVLRDGDFGVMGARRPLAQAFRSSLFEIARSSYSSTILLQVVLTMTAGFVAAVALVRWRGIWAGLMFYAMVYVAGRSFLATFLTESLGLFWALLAIPFLIEGLRSRSPVHAILGIVTLSLALFTRMGSMLTPPALLLWLIWRFGETIRAKAMIGGAGLAALIVLAGLNIGLAKHYAGDAGMIGSNFSFTACGLSIGGTWSDCSAKYAAELAAPKFSDENAVTTLMYQKAVENIVRDPTILARRLFDAARQFIGEVPLVLTTGYFLDQSSYSDVLAVFYCVIAIGVLAKLRAAGWHEGSFWVLFWLSAVMSAGFVYADDGRRVMIAIYPLTALFLASGFARPLPQTRPPGRPLVIRAGIGAAGIMAIVAVSVTLPSVAHAVKPAYFPVSFASSSDPVVFGWPTLTGVLVVADDEALRTDVPTVHLSDFAAAVHQIGPGLYDLVMPAGPPPVPFGLVTTAARADGQVSPTYFFVPPEVLSRKDVAAWRFHTAAAEQLKNVNEFRLVTAAEPLTLDAAFAARVPAR